MSSMTPLHSQAGNEPIDDKDVQIRLYTQADVEQMRNIWNEVVDAGRAFPQTNPLSLEEAQVFFSEQSASVVAEVDGEIAGLYILHPNNIGRCSGVANASYAVAKEARNKGIGARLVCDSVTRAGKLGFSGLQFNAVVASNKGAMHLYEKLGFRRIGMIPSGFVEKSGNAEDIFIYYHPCTNGEEGKVLDVADVVALERKIADEGTSLEELMERAGTALAENAIALLERTQKSHIPAYFPSEDEPEESDSDSFEQRPGSQWVPVRSANAASGDLEKRQPRVLVLAGTGNNGGDGWVAARIMAEAAMDVELVTTKSASDIATEPARSAATKVGNRVKISLCPSTESLEASLDQADIVIDAMLGTGFTHDSIRDPLGEWARLTNKARSRRITGDWPLLVVSADVPSGLNAQTGSAAKECIHADMTVTMLAYKPGLLASCAVPYCGSIVLATLGV